MGKTIFKTVLIGLGDIGLNYDLHKDQEKYINQFTEFSISNTNDLYEDIASANVVVGMNSFALVLALTSAVPTICILPPEANNCVLPQKEIMHLKKM